VDLQETVMPRHLHELQRRRELNVAVARAADKTPRGLGELVLAPLEGPVGEPQDDFHTHLRGSFSGTGEEFPGHGGYRAVGSMTWGKCHADCLNPHKRLVAGNSARPA